MKIVGLTGSISTGKSSVSSILTKHGFVVLDLDQVARDVMAKNSPTLRKVIDTFGNDFLTSDGEIDRPKLAKLIFSDPDARKKLNSITIPAIMWKTAMFLIWEASKGNPLVILDSPLLIEEKLNKSWFIHKVIVVSCTSIQQIERLVDRDKIDQSFAEQKIKSQIPIEKKVELADWVISNDGTREETVKQVETLIASELAPLRARGVLFRNISIIFIIGCIIFITWLILRLTI